MTDAPRIGAAAGFVIGAALGWLFFHDPGDGVVGTVVAAVLLGVAFAVAGHLLAVRPTTSRGSGG